MKREVGRVIVGHGPAIYERASVEEFVDTVDAFVEASRVLIKRGFTREAYMEHEFQEKLTFYGAKNTHILGHAYDEIKQDLSERDKGGTN